jgi:branched-chain amino acid transport system ATP-binding protein
MSAQTGAAILRISGLTKSFGAVTAVDDVSVEVPKGSVFGLIGPNGAGKTTLVNLVTSYLRPDRGDITFAGRSIVGLRPHRLARLGVARTYQNLRLFDNATVLVNILIGRHMAFKGKPWELLGKRRAEERAQHDDARRLAQRLALEEVIGEDIAGLSYGVRRRVEIARAMATQPRLLLLDEPTAGMTRGESDDVGRLIRDINGEGTTVVLVEHNVRLVTQVCDVVGVLDWGRLIALDAPSAVWADAGVRAAYLGGERKAKGA